MFHRHARQAREHRADRRARPDREPRADRHRREMNLTLAFDIILCGRAALILDPVLPGYSFIGAAVYSPFIALNHRRDRCIAA
jgi:hypothetical protein